MSEREDGVAGVGEKGEVKEASERLNEKLGTWQKKYKEADNGRRQEMNGFNRVVMMGRLTRDPKVRELPSGTSVADLSLATSENYKKKNGEQAERVCFVDIVVWGRQAETCGEYLKKGSQVLIEGSLQLDRWEGANGEKRSKHRIRASRVQFLNSRSKEADTPEPVSVGADTGDDVAPF